MFKLTPELADTLMLAALAAATSAAELGEVPVGAVLAEPSGKIVSLSYNQMEHSDASAHAEISVIREASRKLSRWRLEDLILCVTMEPCTMCAGAIRLARIPVVIFGCKDARAGAVGSLYDILADERLGPAPRVISEVRKDECALILKSFFEKRRSE